MGMAHDLVAATHGGARPTDDQHHPLGGGWPRGPDGLQEDRLERRVELEPDFLKVAFRNAVLHLALLEA